MSTLMMWRCPREWAASHRLYYREQDCARMGAMMDRGCGECKGCEEVETKEYSVTWTETKVIQKTSVVRAIDPDNAWEEATKETDNPDSQHTIAEEIETDEIVEVEDDDE